MHYVEKMLFLFVLTALIESAFIAAYHYQATGPLAEPLASHSESLASGVIPPAYEIDIHNDPWVKVAHFESSFGQIQFVVDPVR